MGYPSEQFTRFTPVPQAAIDDVDAMNQPGERPGEQRKLSETPIDDVYADGRPYRGVDKLKGKVALISGGDSGIGRAIAILFALEGADSAIIYLPKEQKDAEDVRDYVSKKTNGERKIHLIAADLKVEENNKKAVDETVKTLGRLDILVLNAAQQLENHDLTTLSSEQWRETFDLNIHSYFYLTKYGVPHMKPGSSIISMCSVNAFIGRPDLLDYTSTKGAIVSFTRGIANQLAEKQIRANGIAPGPVYTPLVPSTFGKDNMKQFDSTALGRPGQPVEIATIAVFLASEDSSIITGNTVHANGGMFVS